MKELCAHFISDDITGMGLAHLSAQLEFREKQKIDSLLWSENGYRPEVLFVLAHTSDSLLLKYTVKEKHLQAVYREINGPVYRDSCVEAFIAFDDKAYYNLEFNCMGTALIGFGPERTCRNNLDSKLIERIGVYSTIGPVDSNSMIKWELTLNIPFSIFQYHKINQLNNEVIKANFYKCGDELPEPHFLSWNNIINDEPDFHLPEFFGSVKFLP